MQRDLFSIGLRCLLLTLLLAFLMPGMPWMATSLHAESKTVEADVITTARPTIETLPHLDTESPAIVETASFGLG